MKIKKTFVIIIILLTIIIFKDKINYLYENNSFFKDKKDKKDKINYLYENNSFFKDKINYLYDNKINSSKALPNLTLAAEKSIKTVVNIKNVYENKYPKVFDTKNKIININIGSGVIISSDGYIITNYHVIKNYDKIEVTLNNITNKVYLAKVIGADPNIDIALIKIKENKLPFIKFSNIKPKVGDLVLAVGNPIGLNSTVTAGIISAINRSLGILNSEIFPIESFIQTDAAINSGNSGSALVNINGDLIGINTAISSKTGSYEGYSFAIPSDFIKKIIYDIKKYGIVQRAFLGVSINEIKNIKNNKNINYENNNYIEYNSGLIIIDIDEKGGAKKAGLKKGDIIFNIDDKPILNFADLSYLLGNKIPGDKIKIKVLRNNIEKIVDVVLTNNEGNTQIKSIYDMTVSEILGLKVKELSSSLKNELGIDYGLKICDLDLDLDLKGKLTSIGLEVGDIILTINDKEMLKPDDINKVKYGLMTIKWLDKYNFVRIEGFILKKNKINYSLF
ncbi:MAG: trypsin-like peptidase domain-containing protein [Candidatus Bostrichicola ureolyticus]|nr:MAG: trypsin-like peptidase domain-containing protein [Candidatus Bostrichicola ureolyticus]